MLLIDIFILLLVFKKNVMICDCIHGALDCIASAGDALLGVIVSRNKRSKKI